MHHEISDFWSLEAGEVLQGKDDNGLNKSIVGPAIMMRVRELENLFPHTDGLYYFRIQHAERMLVVACNTAEFADVEITKS